MCHRNVIERLVKYLASTVPLKGTMYRIVDTFRTKGSLLGGGSIKVFIILVFVLGKLPFSTST